MGISTKNVEPAMRTETDRWGFFDACAVVGRGQRRPAGWPVSPQDLLADMDHHGVAEAMVVDCLARENHPADGNARVVELCKTSPRLHPAWAGLPASPPDEQPPAEEFLAAMRRHRVGAVFLYPNQYRFSLADWCVDPFLEPLAEAGVPAFINPNEVGLGSTGWDESDLNAVVMLCRRMPALPVILSEWRIRRSNRAIYRALDACPNLRIELSGYFLHHGIEFITRNWGADRLVFGSNWPSLGYGGTVAALTMADVSDPEKRQIAGGNMRGLLRWCGTRRPSVRFPPPSDEFVRWGQTGVRPPGVTVYDCHGHLGNASHYHLPDNDLDSVVCEMDRMGVQRAVVFAFCGIMGGDEAFGNDYVAAAVRRFPDRFLGLTLVNPNRGREGMLAELARGQQMGLRGVKVINYYQGLPAEHPLVEVACQWAHQHRQIILNHDWGSPEHLARMVSSYPDACYIVGHTTEAYADVMERHGNIYVCTVPLLGPRDCERCVSRLGADRVIYGSDLLDLPISWGLGPIVFARISPQEKRMILGETLKRLLAQYSLK